MILRGLLVGDHILGHAADSHADWCAAYGRLGAFRIIGASAIGKLHIRDVRSRDDAFTVRTAGEWLAVAVSDGVGSQKYSRYGATYAVSVLSEYLLREALGMGSTFENKAKDDQPISAEEDTSASNKCDKQDIQTNVSGKGIIMRLFGAKSCEPEDKLEQFISAFKLPNSVIPSPDAKTEAGTLTWHCNQIVESVSSDILKASSVSPLVAEDLKMEECIHHAFSLTRQGLDQFSRLHGLDLRKVQCTLLGLLLNTRTGALGVGQLGDGLIAALDCSLGAQELIDAPSPGEVGEVYVLTQSDWERYLAIRILSPQESKKIKTLFLMTDGVAEDYTHTPPPDIFQRWVQDVDREMRAEEQNLPQSATRLLRWLASYEVPGSWDDRTLVVILRDT